MTLYFPSDSIIIRRQRQKSGMRYGYSATGTVHSIDLQPVQAERVNLVGGRIGKTYEGWIDAGITIYEGDQVKVIESGRIYAVKAVSTYEGAGLLDHHHLILMAQD